MALAIRRARWLPPWQGREPLREPVSGQRTAFEALEPVSRRLTEPAAALSVSADGSRVFATASDAAAFAAVETGEPIWTASH